MSEKSPHKSPIKRRTESWALKLNQSIIDENVGGNATAEKDNNYQEYREVEVSLVNEDFGINQNTALDQQSEFRSHVDESFTEIVRQPEEQNSIMYL